MVAVLSLVFAPAAPVFAVSNSWGVDVAGNWADAANWTGGVNVPGAGDTATFDTTLTAARTITVDASRSILNISFGNTAAFAYALSGGSLLLGNGGVIQTLAANGDHTDTVGPAIAIQGVDGAATFSANATSSSSRLNIGAVTGVSTASHTTTLTLDGTNTGSNTVAGVIGDGSAGGKLAVVKSEAGTWTLSATNTYTGATTINAGTLKISTDSGLGTAPTTATAGHLTFVGGTLETTATMTLNSNRGIALAGNGTLSPTSGTLTYNGIIAGSGGTLTKTGAGTLSLGGVNTYDTATIISAGTLTVTNAAGLGAITAGTTVGSGATLNINNVAVGTEAITLSNSTLSGTGANASLGGQITLGADSTLSATTSSSLLTLNGKITGAFGITKTGAGAVALSSANDYTGKTTINEGTLKITADTCLGGDPGVPTAGHLTFGGGTLQVTADMTLSSSRGIALDGAGTISTDAGVDLTYTGIIAGSGGTLTKTGTGTLVLSTTILGGSNTYTTQTNIQNGTVSVASIGNTGASSSLGTNGTIALGSTTTTGTLLHTGGDEDTNKVIDLAGTTGGGTIEHSGAELLKFTSDFTASGAGSKTLTLQGSGTGEIAGAIVDNNATNKTSLTKAGTGTWTLSGTNTYTGTTTVNAGTLTAIDAAGLGASTGALAVNNSNAGTGTVGTAVVLNLSETEATTKGSLSGTVATPESGTNSATINIRGTQTFTVNQTTAGTYAGVLAGIGGGFTLGGLSTSALTLTGANTYTGATTVNNGTLTLKAATGSLDATSTLTMGGAGSFVYDNTGATAAKSQTLGALTFGSGQGTVQTTRAAEYNVTLTFASVARTAGATGNFVVSGGTNGTNNWIALTGQADGFIDQGTFFGGSSYAWYDTGGDVDYVRGIAYGSDANAETSGAAITLASEIHQQITGDITSQDSAIFTTLKDNGNNDITLASGATVTVNGILKTGNVAGGATISGGTGIQAASGAELVVRTDGANDALTISSAILANGSNALTKSGSGTLTLSGANTYTGTTTVGAGVLNIRHDTALGTTAGDTTVASGAALEMQNDITVGADEDLSLTGSGISNGGALRNISGTNTYGGVVTLAGASRINSDAGTLTLNNGTITGATYGLTVGGAGNTTISSILGTTSGTLTKDGAGTLVLSGANTYTGLTTVSSGVLNIRNAAALGTDAAGVTVTTGGALELQNGITVATEALSLGSTGVSSGGGLRNISGTNTYGGAVTLTAASRINSDDGTLTLNSATAITGTFGLTVGGAGDTVISSVIGTTTGTLTKDGAGTLTLSGINTYTGTTTINAGTLRATDNANVLGGGAVTLTGGTLSLSDNDITDYGNDVTISGNATINSDTNAVAGVEHTLGTLAIGAKTLTVGLGATATALTTQELTFGAVTLSGNATINANEGTAQGLLTLGAVSGSGRSLTIGGTADTTIGGIIGTGSGALTKNGTGTLTLTKANTYTGTTTINAGTLLLDKTGTGALADTSNLTLGGGTLNIKGAAGGSTQTLGNLTLTGGTNSEIVINSNGGSGTTLTLGSAWTRGAGSSLLIDISSGNAVVKTAAVTTGVTLTNGIYGAVLVTDTTGTGFATRDAGTDKAITRYTGGTALGVASNDATANFTFSGGDLTWTNSGALTTRAANSLTIDTTGGSGTINMGATSNVLTLTSGAVLFTGDDNDGTLNGGQVGASGSEVIVHQAATGTGTLTIGSLISGGAGSLTKDGAGTLIVSGANTYTGATTVNGGTLKAGVSFNDVTDSGAFGNKSAIIMANSLNTVLDITGFNTQIGSITGGGTVGGNVTLGAATLTLGDDNTSPAAYAGVISGTGGITKIGTGTQTLSGVNTYSGTTTISAGTLRATTSASALGTGGVTLSGGTLSLANDTGLAFNRNVTVSGDSAINSDVLTAGAGVTHTLGTLSMDAHTLTVGLAALATSGTQGLTFGAVTLTGNATINANEGSGAAGLLTLGAVSGAGQNLTVGGTADTTIGGVIGTGAGTLTKNGAGTLTLSGLNTYTGLTTINAGTVKLGDAQGLGTAGSGTVVTDTGAALDLNGQTVALTEALTLKGTGVSSGGALLNSAAGAASYAGMITLAGASTITSAGAGGLSLVGGITTAGYSVTFSGAEDTTVSTVKITGDGGVIKSGAGTLTLSATTNDYTGATTINAGTLKLGAAGVITDSSATTVASGATLDLNGNNETIGSLAGAGTVTSSAAGSRTLTAGGNDTSTSFSGLIENGSGIVAFTKTGTGTLTFSGVHTYTGATTISAGTLALGGATTIAGNWSQDGTSTLNLGTNTLTIAGDMTFADDATLALDTNSASSYGKAIVGGAVTLSADVGITVGYVNSSIASGTPFLVIDGTSGSGVAGGNIVTDSSFVLDFTATTTNNQDLLLTAVRANPLNTISSDANVNAVGAALEGARTTTTNTDMINVLNTLDNMSSAQEITSSLETMMPDMSSGTMMVTRSMNSQFLTTISNRLAYARNGRVMTGIATGDMFQGTGFWMQGVGSHQSQGTRDGIQGFDANTFGTTIGFDKLLDQHLRMGLAGGYGFGSVDAKTPGSPKTDINSWQATLYGSYDSADLWKARRDRKFSNTAARSQGDRLWYVDGMLSFAQNSYDTSRGITIGAESRTAKADYNGQQYSTKFETGYNFMFEKTRALEVTPFTSLGYNYLYMNKYNESGADALNLQVDAEGYNQLEQGIGLKLAYPFLFEKAGTLVPSIRGAWLYDYIGDRYGATSTFSGGGPSFRTEGADPAQSAFLIGSELAFMNHGNMTLLGNFDWELRDAYSACTYYLTVRFDF